MVETWVVYWVYVMVAMTVEQWVVYLDWMWVALSAVCWVVHWEILMGETRVALKACDLVVCSVRVTVDT